MLVVSAAEDHDEAVAVVGKEGVDDRLAASEALLDAIVAYVVVLLAGIGHAVALVHPREVGLVARQPALEGARVGQARQVFVGLVGRAFARLARRRSRRRRRRTHRRC